MSQPIAFGADKDTDKANSAAVAAWGIALEAAIHQRRKTMDDGTEFGVLMAFFVVSLAAAAVLVVLYDRFAHYRHRRYTRNTYGPSTERTGQPMHH